MGNIVFCAAPACWAPGLESKDDWLSWADGKKRIEQSAASPQLEFTSPLFRRRLSQLSRMTVKVVHDALEMTERKDIKQSFISLRGEIARQLSMQKNLISEGDVLPAAFSLSVFNAPIALASIACGLKGGYSAIFPAKGSFHDGLVTALSPILGGGEEEILLVYGDEQVPAEYQGLHSPDDEPLAFACVVAASKSPSCRIPYRLGWPPEASRAGTPALFLKTLLKEGQSASDK